MTPTYTQILEKQNNQLLEENVGMSRQLGVYRDLLKRLLLVDAVPSDMQNEVIKAIEIK